MNDPLAAPPSVNVIPLRLHNIGAACAVSPKHTHRTDPRIRFIGSSSRDASPELEAGPIA